MIGKTISHYRILAKLGEGGMGVVYKAEDIDLKVTRALKFLTPHSANDDDSLTRLKREARAAAALEHPNICQVHEIGHADGQTFIVMSYLKGRTLEDRLASEGPLPTGEALGIAKEVGDALSRAHAAGVVHRDIKPANIMLTDGGHAVVMDFGLVKDADLTRMTRTGTTLGTAAYMSPEQMQGQSVDAKADTWALGVVIYEMLTGRLPFGGDNLPAVAYAVQHKEPEPLTQIRPDAPPDFERVIDRALSKDPGQRYQSMDEFQADLEAVLNQQELARKTAHFDRRRKLKRNRRLLYGVAATVVIAALAFTWWSRYQDSHRIDALAVLPFANLSGDKEQEFFSDGMTEALITELQQLASDQMRVVGRTSVMSFKGSDKTLPEIAAALGVDAVVEASVIRSGNLVKVAAKLIRARPQEQQLWADTYERNISDILSLYSELAREVATQIRIVLTPDAQVPGTGSRAVDPDAYEAYLKGRHFLLNLDLAGVQARDPQALENFHLIKSFFTKSIQMDSTYAPAWAGLAQYHIQREHRLIGSHAIEEAHAAAARAIDLDDSLGEAHCAMGHILWEHQYRPREAEGEFRRALKLNPNDPLAHALYSYCLMTLGRYQESTRSMQMALELDPLSRFINYVGWAPLAYARKYDEALRQLDKYHESYPDPQFYRNTKFDILKSAGRYEEALDLVDELDPAENNPELQLLVPPVLMALGKSGDAKEYLEGYRSRAAADSLFFLLGRAEASVDNLDQARQWLDKSDEASNSSPMNLALLSAMIGDLDRAFAYLEMAYDSNNWYLTRLAYLVENDPDWKVLGPDPRYHDLVGRMGLRD